MYSNEFCGCRGEAKDEIGGLTETVLRCLKKEKKGEGGKKGKERKEKEKGR